MAGDGVFRGNEPVAAAMSDFGAMQFIAQAVANRIATATLVQIVAVDTGATLVDIHPMIAQLDGIGNATPHGVIHNVPYVRLQGGGNAVIIDPEVGDIGIAVFASHDISAVKASKAPGTPGSRRRFSMADAIYIGGLLNGEPERYVKISSAGIEIKAPTVHIIGNVTVTGDVTAGTVSLRNHTHSGVQAGGGTSGPPVP